MNQFERMAAHTESPEEKKREIVREAAKVIAEEEMGASWNESGKLSNRGAERGLSKLAAKVNQYEKGLGEIYDQVADMVENAEKPAEALVQYYRLQQKKLEQSGEFKKTA